MCVSLGVGVVGREQGKLAVVFSDESLAFGVNMPFRTCTFVEDTPGMLDSLMAAQMSGKECQLAALIDVTSLSVLPC